MSPEAILSWFSLAIFGLAVVFAIVAGGRAERIGGAIGAANFLLTVLAQGLTGAELPYITLLLIDLAAALAFGALALRFPEKLWPGVAGVAQTMVIVFSATRALDFPLSEEAYAAALNLSSLGVAGSLVAGSFMARWPRMPLGSEAAAATA